MRQLRETPTRDMWIGAAIGAVLAVPAWIATLWVLFG
jgi:Mg/Co/Ni transporter MgtE